MSNESFKSEMPASLARLHRRGALVVIGSIVIAAILADRKGWLLVPRIDDMAAYHGVQATVIRAIDGDTIEVDLADAVHDRPVTHIALWGINCPEPARAARPAEPWSSEATEFTRTHCEGSTVTLWMEAHQSRDALGRVLAHAELPDGGSLNAMLLEAGLAKADDRQPHSMITKYAQAEMSARRRALGLWSKPEAGGSDQ